jgi:hypothetical protein
MSLPDKAFRDFDRQSAATGNDADPGARREV